VQRPTQTGLLRCVPVGLGAALGIGIVLTSSDAVRAAPLWWVWAPLAVALTTTGGAVFVYGLDRWAELTSDHPTSVRRAAPRIAAIGTIAAVSVVCAQLLLAGPTRGSWRFLALISSFLGAIPAFAVTEGIRLTASEPAPAEPSGAQVAELLWLRQLLQRILAAVGSLVALSTLATGAVLALQRSLPAAPGGTALPAQTVVIFGGAGSLLVALFYVPAATALQRRGQRLCESFFPLQDATEAADILRLTEDRHQLAQHLGADRGVVADLQTGLAILGPLLASAAAAFLAP
jgi:hypothetical protein